MDFVCKLYGNTYAVHVTVALVGVATLNLALPAPLTIIKHILTSSKILPSLKSEWFGTFCKGFKSGSSPFIFFNVLYNIALETKVQIVVSSWRVEKQW